MVKEKFGQFCQFPLFGEPHVCTVRAHTVLVIYSTFESNARSCLLLILSPLFLSTHSSSVLLHIGKSTSSDTIPEEKNGDGDHKRGEISVNVDSSSGGSASSSSASSARPSAAGLVSPPPAGVLALKAAAAASGGQRTPGMDSGSDDCCEGGGNDCEGYHAAAGGGEGVLEGGGAGGVSSVEREVVLVEEGSIESSTFNSLPGRDCDSTCDSAFADGDVQGAGRVFSKDSVGTLEVGGAAVDGEEDKGELGGGIHDLDKVSADAASVSSRKKDKGCHHCCLI